MRRTRKAAVITRLKNVTQPQRLHAKAQPQRERNKSKKRRWSQGLISSILPFLQQKRKSSVVVIQEEEGYDTKEDTSSCASTEVAENEQHAILAYGHNGQNQDQRCSHERSFHRTNETTDTFVFDYIVDDDGEIIIREDETVGSNPSYVTDRSLETAYELEWDGLKYSGSIIARMASESTEESEEDEIIIVETNGNVEDENNEKNQQVGMIWNSIFFCNTTNPKSERIARRITGYCTMNEFGFNCGNVYCVSFKAHEVGGESWRFARSSSSLAQVQMMRRRKNHQTDDSPNNPQSDDVSVLSEDDTVNSIIEADEYEHEVGHYDKNQIASINGSKQSPPSYHEQTGNKREAETDDVGTETILLAEMKLKTKSEMEDSNRSSRTEVVRNTSNSHDRSKNNESSRRLGAVILQNRASVRKR